MLEASFNRLDMITRGDEVKQHVFDAILAAKNVKMTKETYAQFVLTAFIVMGAVVRAQLLERMMAYQNDGQFNEATVDKTIRYLCNTLDLEADKLGNQVMLINEVKNAPAVRH